jgi:hypothetical protein
MRCVHKVFDCSRLSIANKAIPCTKLNTNQEKSLLLITFLVVKRHGALCAKIQMHFINYDAAQITGIFLQSASRRGKRNNQTFVAVSKSFLRFLRSLTFYIRLLFFGVSTGLVYYSLVSAKKTLNGKFVS